MSIYALTCKNNATYGGLYYCDDFTLSGPQPVWVKLTTVGLLNLECSHFRVDYGDPLNRQFVRMSSDGSLYYRNNSDWTKILDVASAAAVVGKSATNAQLKHLYTDPTTPGSVYCNFMTDPGDVQSGDCHVMKSLDYGASWTATTAFYTTARGVGAVEVIGDHIWASCYKILIAASLVNYSDDGGATWKGIAAHAGSDATNPTVRINPNNPNECILTTPVAKKYWTYSGGYSTRDLPFAITGTITERTDKIWFDPNTSGRVISCNPEDAIYYSDDNFLTYSTTTQTSGGIGDGLKCAIIGPYGSASGALAYGNRVNTTSHSVGVLSSETDVSAENRAGTNTSTPPYTNAVPEPVDTSEYGIWWGYPPADKGIFIYSVEEGDITNIPDADNLGLPLFGDRSSWRDLDADDDGLAVPTALSSYHAEDIYIDTPQRHNPWPAASGEAPVSDGTKWVPTDIITQAEFDYSFYVGTHCPVTLDADAALVLDLQGGCTPAQEIGLDTQQPTYVFIGPSFMPPDEPTFRPMYIEELANVTTTAPVLDGEVLTFDGGSGEWVNEAPVTKHNRTVTTLTAGSYTLDNTYDVVVLDATAGDIEITLPLTSLNDGLEYAFKRIDDTGNIVSIMVTSTTLLDSDGEILLDSDGEILVDSEGGTGDTIDGDTVQYLDSQYLAIQIVADADGSAWWII